MLRYLDVTYLDDDAANLPMLLEAVQACETSPAGFCVFPKALPQVNSALFGKEIASITVVNFPAGTSSLVDVLQEIKAAQALQAQEIDVVIPYSAFLQTHDEENLIHFVEAVRRAHTGTLKFIVETGAFTDMADVRKIADLLCCSNADFIKTSTGKINQGATPEAVTVICQVIAAHYQQTQKRVGIKISGGVRHVEQLQSYLDQIKTLLGESWLHPDRLRIGASQLFWQLHAHSS